MASHKLHNFWNWIWFNSVSTYLTSPFRVSTSETYNLTLHALIWVKKSSTATMYSITSVPMKTYNRNRNLIHCLSLNSCLSSINLGFKKINTHGMDIIHVTCLKFGHSLSFNPHKIRKLRASKTGRNEKENDEIITKKMNLME